MILSVWIGSTAALACAGDEPEWGTVAETVVTVPGSALVPMQSTPFRTVGNRKECLDPAPCLFGVPWQIPNGVVLTKVTLEACDYSASARVRLTGYPCPVNQPCAPPTHYADTGVAETPGCLTWVSPPLSYVVNNHLLDYALVAEVDGGNLPGTAFVASVRIYYRLQVSPAPATATFSDVPTAHPFFRFVEALAASGITGGCGGGAYCPDAPLTRGQMAVFLATALGLHWP